MVYERSGLSPDDLSETWWTWGESNSHYSSVQGRCHLIRRHAQIFFGILSPFSVLELLRYFKLWGSFFGLGEPPYSLKTLLSRFHLGALPRRQGPPILLCQHRRCIRRSQGQHSHFVQPPCVTGGNVDFTLGSRHGAHSLQGFSAAETHR